MSVCWWGFCSSSTQLLGCNFLEVLLWTPQLQLRDITILDTSSRVFYCYLGKIILAGVLSFQQFSNTFSYLNLGDKYWNKQKGQSDKGHEEYIMIHKVFLPCLSNICTSKMVTILEYLSNFTIYQISNSFQISDVPPGKHGQKLCWQAYQDDLVMKRHMKGM